MDSGAKFDAWSVGQSYEQYMGRWSRKIAANYLSWLEPPTGVDWLEVGCGTGALTEAILTTRSPKSIIATDASDDFVKHAQTAISDPRATFQAANAQQLPIDAKSVDVVTSALVMNFVPDKALALEEMQRVLRPSGLLSFYVWDYPGGGVGFIDTFWKAAAEIDPKALELDEGARFPFCTSKDLRAICGAAGVVSPTIAPIKITTGFENFEDFWMPFTLGAGPAPGYCMSLPVDHREALKQRLKKTIGESSPFDQTARAWAIKANVSG